MSGSHLIPIVIEEVYDLFTFSKTIIDVYWCVSRFPCQTMFVSFNRRVSLVEQELLTRPWHLSSPLVYSGLRVARSLVFCAVFCRSLLVLMSFFYWSLCCVSFDLRILQILLHIIILDRIVSYDGCWLR